MGLFKKKTRNEGKETVKPAEKTEGTNVKSVLKQPWFSERATLLASRGKYIFLVAPEATKPAVRDEIQRRYGVRVTGVNMITLKGKMKHFGSKMGRRSGVKKAIVTLKAGDKIEIQ